jgi:DNA repair exonuclease SbcCD ATPase subunit
MGASGAFASLIDRLSGAAKPGETWDVLVLAALDGPDALAGYLDASVEPKRPAQPIQEGATPEPPGAYLKSITVQGFRGIGESKTLELPPGPGLTLVVGRNGSGKSSFAEALELLVTGDTYRWAHRAKVWKLGWRNLHHKTAAIEAAFNIEGEKGTTVVATRWKDDADLEGAETFAQTHGKPRTELAALRWEQALATYRPFLSYNELGSMLDEGPAKLYDALAVILGLEELTEATETLAEARRTREKAHKEAEQRRDEILDLLRRIDDDRARSLVVAIEKKDWGLEAAEAALAKATSSSGADSEVQILRQLANLQAPTPEAIATVVRELREAQARVIATANTLAARSKDLAEILDQALRFHTKHGDAACPVCGKPKALDAKWHDHQAKEIEQLREKARDATEAHRRADEARRKALALPSPQPEALAKSANVGLDAYAATMALETWRAGLTATADLDALAQHIEGTAGKLEAATTALRAAATAELQGREDRWKPVVPPLAAWLDQAKKAQKGDEAVKPLKAAEKWLKDAAEDIRNERFAPIKEKAQQIWNQLRMQSNVALEGISLTGSGNRRQVELDVTVDGTKGAALGVMSQGEQNALALSLFIPRATLADSPFRFVVIDDPVQSMDPSRIDGLARVLHETAGKRQVVVFTHDDRLPEAVRRLVIPATVIEVTRREGSVVELRQTRDPVARYIEDALAVAFTDALPPQAARRVVPGLCRLAIEAACTEAVRRRRIGRGEPHAAVEDLLSRLNGSKPLAALALFDDEKRTGDALPHLHKKSKDAADTFRLVNEGSHVELAGPIVDLVRNAEKLAGWMQTLT